MENPDQTTSTNNGSGQAVVVRMVGYDKPLLTAVAIALALVAIFMAYTAEREARMAQYYINQCLIEGVCRKADI